MVLSRKAAGMTSKAVFIPEKLESFRFCELPILRGLTTTTDERPPDQLQRHLAEPHLQREDVQAHRPGRLLQQGDQAGGQGRKDRVILGGGKRGRNDLIKGRMAMSTGVRERAGPRLRDSCLRTGRVGEFTQPRAHSFAHLCIQ